MSAIAQIHEQKQGVGFKCVLIATDFSAASERALAYALPMVRRYGSMVSIVHAILPETRESITWDPCHGSSTGSDLRQSSRWGASPKKRASKT
jgi:hypothetical protein